MKNIYLALLLLFAFATSGYCETENYYDNILKSSSGDISKLEKISPDFSSRVFNDTNLNENQKYNIAQRYRSLTDGESAEAFSCDCFDFLKKTYVKNKTRIGNAKFRDFLVKEAVKCDFTSGLPRYNGINLKEFSSNWKVLKDKISIKDDKIIQMIDENIKLLEKTAEEQ